MLSSFNKRRPWQLALMLTLVMRVIYSGMAALFSLFLHPDPQLIRSNTFTDTLGPASGIRYAWVDIWQRFDTLWYLHIAANGYDRPAAVTFYPLYPLLVRTFSAILAPTAAAILISTVAAWFLFWGFWELALLDLSPAHVVRGALLYAVWPTSFIFFAGYADGLAIALILWSIYFGRKQRWWPAAVCGAFAGLTRAVGALAFVSLIVLAVQSRKWKSWPLLIAGLGAIAYPAWLRFSGHTSLIDAYRDYWHIQTVAPWTTMQHILTGVGTYSGAILIINLVLLFMASALAFAAPRRLEYCVYSLLVVAQILMRLEYLLLLGASRYLLALFPAFLGVAKIWGRTSFQRRMPMIFLVLLAWNLAWMWAFLGWSLSL